MQRLILPLTFALAAALALPAVAHAGFTGSASGTTFTLTGTDGNEALVIGRDGDFLSNGRATAGDAGFVSDFDWDSVAGGEQRLSANGSIDVRIEARGGEDRIDVTGGTGLRSLLIDGGDGADLIDGSAQSGAVETLAGGAGDDRLTGNLGDDVLTGGAGDDVFPWFVGDGDDKGDGGDGTDSALVAGAAAGETYAVSAGGGRQKVSRSAPSTFSLDLSVDRVSLSTLGGDDTVTVTDGVPVTLDGGGGADKLTGDTANDVLIGGTGADSLKGGAGNDLLEGGGDADAIDARDGGADLVACGDGADSATLDVVGTDTSSGCETLDQPAAPAPPPAARFGVSVDAGQRIRMKGRKLGLVIKCRKTLSGCPGTIDIVTRGKVRVGKTRAIVKLASAAFDLTRAPTTTQPNTQTLTFTLPRGFESLVPEGSKQLKLNAVIINANGIVATVGLLAVLRRAR